jgi:hypothetical protein
MLRPAPLPKSGMPRKRPFGAVTCRCERLAFRQRIADQNIGSRTHAAADQHRLTDAPQCLGKAGVTGSKSSRGPLAVNIQFAFLAIHDVLFDFASIVRAVELQLQVAAWKEIHENPPSVVANDFAIGQRTIDHRTHGAEIA